MVALGTKGVGVAVGIGVSVGTGVSDGGIGVYVYVSVGGRAVLDGSGVGVCFAEEQATNNNNIIENIESFFISISI